MQTLGRFSLKNGSLFVKTKSWTIFNNGLSFSKRANEKASTSKISQRQSVPKQDPEAPVKGASFRPTWLVFSGLGSQNNQIPKDLYRIEPFAESLKHSREICKNLGYDMNSAQLPGNKKIYTCLPTAVMSIMVLQMALYDTIRTLLPVPPSGFVGHSNGETLCAYADGALTPEETLKLGIVRAQTVVDTLGSSFGGMAAVGMSWEQIQSRVPRDIFPACNNAKNLVIVSGPRQSIQNFIKELDKESIFAREVPACGCPAHSPYIEDSVRHFGEYAKTFLPKETAKLRSAAWICTSAPEKDWDSPAMKYASWEYLAYGLWRRVYFYEALLHIPKNAFVVEISPKAIFQGIIKETVGSDSKYFSTIHRNATVSPDLLSKQKFFEMLMENQEN